MTSGACQPGLAGPQGSSYQFFEMTVELASPPSGLIPPTFSPEFVVVCFSEDSCSDWGEIESQCGLSSESSDEANCCTLHILSLGAAHLLLCEAGSSH